MDGGKVTEKNPFFFHQMLNFELFPGFFHQMLNFELFPGGLHHDGLRAETEEVLGTEGGEDQVCPKQDLASFQDTSLCQTGDNLVILSLILVIIVLIIIIIMVILSIILAIIVLIA